MASPPTAIDRRGHLRVPTLRRDSWWLQPLVTVLVLLGFVVYGIWVAPPACAVRDARARYSGETKFPLTLQNIHRYFFYLALPFPIILLWDGIQGFHFRDGWGMGLGSLVLVVNAVLLGLYTLSCHSCRHLCGGQADRFSKAPVRFRLWRWTTALNSRHMLYAWVSLVFVALTDLYVRLVAVGTIHDPRFF